MTPASLFSTTDEYFHAELRRCVNSAFSMTALVQYEPSVDDTTLLFLDQTESLFSSQNKICDFAEWLQFYAFDVIGEITYSKRHGFVERGEDVDGMVKYLGRLFSYVAPVCLSQMFNFRHKFLLTIESDRPITYTRSHISQEPDTSLPRQIQCHVLHLPNRHLCKGPHGRASHRY